MRKKILALAAFLAVAGTLVVGQAVPPGTGLIAYWTLNDATDPTALETAGSAPQNNGTYLGTTLPTTSASVPQVLGVAHPPGNTASRVFTQATGQQRVEVPDDAELDLIGAFTLAAWVNPTGAQTNQLGIIEHWSGVDPIPGINGYFLRLSPAMVPKASIGNGAAQFEVQAAGLTPLPAATWSHVAATFNGSNTLRIYVNGTLNNTNAAVTPPTAGAAPLHIGVDYGANRFDGNIDDVRIYNRALSDLEIGVLRNGLLAPVLGAPVSGPGLVDLSWAAVANATSYQVFQGLSATGPWILVGSPVGTTFTDLSVVNPTPYFYSIVAVGLMESPRSNVQGPVIPASLIPRTSDHEEGLFGTQCACGSTVTTAPIGAALAALALLGTALLRRRFNG